MLSRIVSLLPGLGFTAVIAFAAWFGTAGLIQLSDGKLRLEALLLGIMLGILVRNVFGMPALLKPGVDFSAKTILEFTVVLIGFKLSLGKLAGLGLPALAGVLLLVPLIIGTAMLISRLSGLPLKLLTLIGVGTGICGSSAIVAMAPCIKADDEDAVLAISGMNVLGALGVLAFAALAHNVPLSDIQYGVWAGMSLQAVPTTLAAAAARQSELALEVGTVVKMARVALLVPASLVLHYIFARGGNGGKRAGIPWYVTGFVVAALINSLGLIGPLPAAWIKQGSDWLMLLAMTALGLSVDLRSVKSKALPAMAVSAALFLLAALCAYFWASLVVPAA